MISTMQWLRSENARLRRTGKIDGLVYWAGIIGVVIVALLERMM